MEENLELDGSRKRDKIRSAWISFVGRIAAQLIGAIATVTLGVVVLSRHIPPAAAAVPPPVAAVAPAPTVLIATPIRTHGETVIVLLPLGTDGQIDHAMAAQVAESYEKTKAMPPRAGAPRQTPTDRPSPQSGDRSADSRASLGFPHE
jgi:hypothetical protein